MSEVINYISENEHDLVMQNQERRWKWIARGNLLLGVLIGFIIGFLAAVQLAFG